MSNVDAPRGLIPVAHRNGAPYNGACNKYYIPSTDATNMFIGDPVRLAGDADTPGNYPTIALSAPSTAATGISIGVIVGFEPVEGVSIANTNLSRIYRPASMAMYANVADDPDLIFEVQEDSVGGSLAATNVGSNVNFTSATAGSTVTGFSGVEIDSSTVNTTAKQFRILGKVARPNNDLGTNCKWLVAFNGSAGHRTPNTTGV